MAGVIDSIKGGRYNESESAKLIMGGQHQVLKDDIDVLKTELESLGKENASLRANVGRGADLQSAMQSNNAAINDKIESSNRLIKEKESELV